MPTQLVYPSFLLTEAISINKMSPELAIIVSQYNADILLITENSLSNELLEVANLDGYNILPSFWQVRKGGGWRSTLKNPQLSPA
ncbi:hypothetical protein GJ496_007114 [Pomphorhynchus laevis]|nr:hypothetical protein GJ496_007114 [Pomphorhynchus laevis]